MSFTRRQLLKLAGTTGTLCFTPGFVRAQKLEKPNCK